MLLFVAGSLHAGGTGAVVATAGRAASGWHGEAAPPGRSAPRAGGPRAQSAPRRQARVACASHAYLLLCHAITHKLTLSPQIIK